MVLMLVRPSRPAMRDGREELLLEACWEERTATRMCASLGLRLFLGGEGGLGGHVSLHISMP